MNDGFPDRSRKARVCGEGLLQIEDDAARQGPGLGEDQWRAMGVGCRERVFDEPGADAPVLEVREHAQR